MAALLLDEAQLFVLAHEVSHVVLLRHTADPTTTEPDLPHAALIDSAEATELAADILAFHIVTEDLRRAGPSTARRRNSGGRGAGTTASFLVAVATSGRVSVLRGEAHPT